MNARFYSPSSGRFISADTIIPDPTNPQQHNRYTYTLNNPIRFVDPTGHNCAQAQDDPSVYNYCKSLEQQILASTVRIEIKGWYVSGSGNGSPYQIAHATVVDGQHVLTHNHFELLTALENGAWGQVTNFTIRDTEGNVLFGPASAKNFNISASDSQTLLIDLGITDILNVVGIPSAEFATASELALSPGQEVGQVDWDGQSTFVEWTTIKEFTEIDGTPVVVLDNFVEHGASGGGVYYGAVHFANNWSRVPSTLETHAALNSSLTVTPQTPH